MPRENGTHDLNPNSAFGAVTALTGGILFMADEGVTRMTPEAAGFVRASPLRAAAVVAGAATASNPVDYAAAGLSGVAFASQFARPGTGLSRSGTAAGAAATVLGLGSAAWGVLDAQADAGNPRAAAIREAITTNASSAADTAIQSVTQAGLFARGLAHHVGAAVGQATASAGSIGGLG